MAFRTFATDGQAGARAAREQVQLGMLPLTLELIPPVLCQSFGVPMHSSDAMQRSMLSYNVQQVLQQRADMLRFGAGLVPGAFSAAEQQMQFPFNFGFPSAQFPQMGCDPRQGTGFDVLASGMLQSAAASATGLAQHAHHQLHQPQQPMQSLQLFSQLPQIDTAGRYGSQKACQQQPEPRRGAEKQTTSQVGPAAAEVGGRQHSVVSLRDDLTTSGTRGAHHTSG
jgi:hypothetical protein